MRRLCHSLILIAIIDVSQRIIPLSELSQQGNPNRKLTDVIGLAVVCGLIPVVVGEWQ